MAIRSTSVVCSHDGRQTDDIDNMVSFAYPLNMADPRFLLKVTTEALVSGANALKLAFGAGVGALFDVYGSLSQLVHSSE